MMEARIKCLCADYRIADLNLTLTSGQIIYVPESKARGSSDLQHASKVRAVEIRWGSRCTVLKDPAPTDLKRRVHTFPTPRHQMPFAALNSGPVETVSIVQDLPPVEVRSEEVSDLLPDASEDVSSKTARRRSRKNSE